MNRTALIAGLGIVSVAIGSLLAQEQPDQQRRSRRSRFDYRRYMFILPSGMIQQMKQRGQMDESQSQRVEALAKEFDEKFVRLRKEFAEQCAPLMTAQQREAVEKMIKDQEEYRAASPRRPLMENDPRMLRYAARRLDLTDQQKEQMEALLTQHEANVEALGDNTEAIKQLNELTSNQIRALMTAEQQQKLEELRQQRSRPGRGNRGDRSQQ